MTPATVFLFSCCVFSMRISLYFPAVVVDLAFHKLWYGRAGRAGVLLCACASVVWHFAISIE